LVNWILYTNKFNPDSHCIFLSPQLVISSFAYFLHNILALLNLSSFNYIALIPIPLEEEREVIQDLEVKVHDLETGEIDIGLGDQVHALQHQNLSRDLHHQ